MDQQDKISPIGEALGSSGTNSKVLMEQNSNKLQKGIDAVSPGLFEKWMDDTMRPNPPLYFDNYDKFVSKDDQAAYIEQFNDAELFLRRVCTACEIEFPRYSLNFHAVTRYVWLQINSTQSPKDERYKALRGDYEERIKQSLKKGDKQFNDARDTFFDEARRAWRNAPGKWVDQQEDLLIGKKDFEFEVEDMVQMGLLQEEIQGSAL